MSFKLGEGTGYDSSGLVLNAVILTKLRIQLVFGNLDPDFRQDDKSRGTMNRNQLQNLLQNYYPTDPGEQLSKERMLEFLTNHPDCFERTCVPGHFTASSWLLNKDGSQALLLLHKKFDTWLQPGGHCDGDTDVLRVAIKEAQEESGIIDIKPVSASIFDIDVHLILPHGSDLAHYHYDVRFLLQVQSDEPLICSAESHALQWFGKDATTFPTQNRSIMRMFEKWIAQ